MCTGVDELLAAFAAAHGATIDCWIEDTPSRVVFWRDGDFHYTISLLLRADPVPSLALWAAAWQDDEERRQRQLLSLPEQTLALPPPLEALQVLLGSSAVRLAQESRAGSRLVTLPLPPHPDEVAHTAHR